MTKDIDALVERLKKARHDNCPRKDPPEPFYHELQQVLDDAIQALTSQQHKGKYRVVWLVVDKDGDPAGSVTSEKEAKQYEKLWNQRSHEAEVSESGYPYKAVKAYILEGE